MSSTLAAATATVSGYTIRHAIDADLDAILGVEASAGEKWHSVPALASLSGQPTLTVASLKSVRSQDGGVVLVARSRKSNSNSCKSDGKSSSDEADKVIGVLVAFTLDEATFVHELDVAEAHQRRGIGRALLETLRREREVEELARVNNSRARAVISLTTFREIPWNAPWYSKVGFQMLESDEEVEARLGKGHAQRFRDEREFFAEYEAAGYTRCIMFWD